MSSPSFRHLAVALWLITAVGLRAQSTEIVVTGQGAQTEVALSWAADGGVFYDILSTTNLNGGVWVNLTADAPVAASSLIGTLTLLSSNSAAFFRVRPVDTQGPTIMARYPGEYAVGVGRSNALTVVVSDASGIDTSSLRLTVNGGAALANGAAGVTVTTNRFQYNPVAVGTSWGAFGATVTVTFACLDLKGNATRAEWSFCLEVEPIIAGNLLHLPAPAPLKGAPVRLAMPPPPGVVFLGGLTIIEFLSDRIVFAYTGEHGLYVGAILVSHDPDRPFYRRILSIESGPGGGQVTAFTEDVPLTDIVQNGSFSPEVFIPVGGQAQALWGDADLGMSIDFGTDFGFTLAEVEWEAVEWTAGVRLENVSVTGHISGGLDMACEIRDWQFVALEVAISDAIEVTVHTDLVFWGSFAYTNTLWEIPESSLGKVWGSIGVVPVWLDLSYGLKLDMEAEAEAALTVENLGLQTYIESRHGLRWTPGDGIAPICENTFSAQPLPFTSEGGIDLSASAYVYAKPYLSAKLYSAVGVMIDYRRGPSLEAEWRVGDPQAQFSLFDKSSLNGELTIVGVDQQLLPTVKFFEEKNPLFTYYWPEIPESAPTFTVQPVSVAAAVGHTVVLSASASGTPAPTYQWFQNGTAIPGMTWPQLTFFMGASSIGTYTCRASNSRGTATSQSATISLPVSTPVGMALIPAGSFQMGDSFAEGSTAERPVHSVYVSEFYMDKYEVTWAKWQEVRTWAAANGYDIGSVGVGKAANHPVHSVNWYDVLKWCNARSQMEGKTPAYYTSSNRTTANLYKTGQVNIQNDWVRWDAGYRLPTEAEWEKAARGGLSGRRFPWGANINHGNANYRANGSAYTYDTSPYTTSTYHPNFNDGTMPYTSPVGSFVANGYGLYDMAGNVWEWCWDWYGSSYYSSSPGSDPRGTSTGSYRVFRGGSWGSSAYYCRVAYRNNGFPNYRNYGVGFRAVLPPGQQ